MKSGPGTWLLGTAASVALHGAGAVVALALVAPEDMPDQPNPGAAFELETTALERSRAEERATEGQEATGVAPDSPMAQGQGIARREAPAAPPPAAAAPALADQGAAAPALAAPGARAQAQAPEAPRAEGAALPSAAAPAERPEGAAAAPVEAAAPVAEVRAPVSAAATVSSLPDARVPAAGLEGGAIQAAFQPPERRAAPSAPSAPPVRAEAPGGQRATAAVPEGALATVAAPASEPAAPATPESQRTAAQQPESARAAAAAPETERAAAATPEGQRTAAAVPQAERAAAATPQAERADAATPESRRTSAAAAEGTPTAAAAPGGTPAVAAAVEGAEATAQAAEGPVIGAALAWAGQGALDPQGLAAVQAFLPEAARGKEGAEVRDDISALMSSVPCARVHTAFNAETGALEVRGHVPTDAARPDLVGALQARVGETLPVQDALRLLPEPQCDVLTGIEGLGLPPSEEQFTDPALVGETGWAQDYAFTDGQRLTLDLEGPDYPAHVYLDYFDGAGNVVHIVPNEIVSLPSLGPAERFSVGRDDGLDLIISAPFGQDIVVALATDVPLYEGLRPTVEEAGPYLDFLRERLEALSDVRGEWAYFFVTTAPR